MFNKKRTMNDSWDTSLISDCVVVFRISEEKHVNIRIRRNSVKHELAGLEVERDQATSCNPYPGPDRLRSIDGSFANILKRMRTTGYK